MNLGFTGTRNGMTREQMQTLQRIVQAIAPARFHHGACVGADEQAVVAVRYFLPPEGVVAYPPDDDKLISPEAIRLSGVVRPPEPYLKRNMAIVRASWVLVATPEQSEEQMRSGTWTTIRYGRAAKHPVFIIRPNGLIEVQ